MMRFILPFLSLCVIYGESFAPTSRTISNERTCCFASIKDEEARRFKEEANRIRAEVASFEQEKKNVELEEERKEREIISQKEKVRTKYSAEVPILKGDGSTVVERVDFAPRVKEGLSRIEVCSASLPLGIILGESEEFPGAISVDEVGIGSNGELAGVQEGDLLRACTACQVTMETPTWQILAGGIGMPKTKRFVYSCDNRPFEEVMDAVGSNRMDPEGRPVLLVVERK
jgi:hypothetical protein